MKIDAKSLSEKFSSSCQKISYSKFKNFSICESSWFVGNFIESDQKVVNQRYAVSGTIIQRIFQSIINDRKYNQYKSSKDLKNWIKQNVYGLSEILLFPLENQYLEPYKNREFYKTEQGLALIEKIQKRYPLFDITTDISPNFIKFSEFCYDHKTVGAFAEKLSNIAIECCFNFLKIDITSTVSETYLKYETPSGTILSGIVDFIEKDYTKESYFIFDGKMNLNAYVSDLQLIFYSYLIYKNYGTLPYKTGFLGWKENILKEVQVAESDFMTLETEISTYEKRCIEIKNILNSIEDDYITLEKVLSILDQTPSYTTCKFCSIKESCPKSYKSKKKQN